MKTNEDIEMFNKQSNKKPNESLEKSSWEDVPFLISLHSNLPILIFFPQC